MWYRPRPVLLGIVTVLLLAVAAWSMLAAAETKPVAPAVSAPKAATPLPDLRTVADGLWKRYQSISTLTSEFTQSYQSRITKQVTEGKGVMYVKKPRKMRWDYKGSPERIYAYDGATFFVVEPARKSMAITRVVMQKELSLALVFLTGEGRIEEHFHLKVIDPAHFEADIPIDGRIVLELLPKEETENVAVMYLLLTPQTYEVTEVVLYDLVGNRNRIRFTNIANNAPVKDEQFTLTAPKDWTVEQW